MKSIEEGNQDLGIRSDNLSEIVAIPVIEEVLNITKEIVESGRIRIIKKVVEEEITVNDPIVKEEVEVERISLNQDVTEQPPSVRYEGDTMIVPVLKEVLVVEKRIILIEELRVTKRKIEVPSSQQITIRKEEVNIERIENHFIKH